jgi:hypothetical protein
MPVKTQNEKLMRDARRTKEQSVKTKISMLLRYNPNKRLNERLAHIREY